MIELALLFGLGFLTAAFIAMLLAPAIHRRIVRFTENRLRATMPLSPQEVRAQKDMVRASYAAENARARQDLVREREKGVALQLGNEALAKEAGRLQSDNAELRMQINDMNVEAADMRSQLRREDNYATHLKGKLDAAEQAGISKDLEMQSLQKRLNKMVADVDNLKIELAARDTQIESLKFRLNTLRDEREALRHDLKLVSQRAKDAEIRLTQEEHKALHLEDRLTRQQADNADKENIIERRVVEINRLREKLKNANTESRGSARALRHAGSPRPADKSSSDRQMVVAKRDAAAASADAIPAAFHHPEGFTEGEIKDLAEDVRNQSTALAERLLRAGTGANDAALRDEISTVAAKMVVLTAMQEGPQSPIPAILSGTPATGSNDRKSLADRIIEAIPAGTAR